MHTEHPVWRFAEKLLESEPTWWMPGIVVLTVASWAYVLRGPRGPDRRRRLERLYTVGVIAIGAVPFIIAGAYFMSLAATDAWFAVASMSWPSTEGQVVDSKLLSADGRPQASVRYRYTVEGVEYESSRIAFGLVHGLDRDEEFVASLTVGSRTPVYYHPERVEQSVLQPGLRLSMLAVFLAGAVPAAVGLWLASRPSWFVGRMMNQPMVDWITGR